MYSGRLIVPNVCFAPKASTAVMITPNLRTKATTEGLVTLSSMVLPARDRIIDFGKYKGRMLGTLPSSYLKWVSKNLRARDYEDWAKRADEVVTDPVYRDRIEWEFAEKVLNGDVSSFSSRSDDQVAELLGVSERFGWNNEDEVGWSKIDFGLLGTSKGGRIPRLGGVAETEALEKKKREKIGGGGQGVERRRERRERLRLRKSTTTATASSSSPITRNGKSAIMRLGNHHGLEDDDDDDDNVVSETRNYEEKNNNRSTCNEEVRTAATTGTSSSSSPFPGRRALVKKVLLNGRKGG